MAESKEELKRLLVKVKEESEKSDLKLSIFKKQRSWHPVPTLHGKQMGKQWKLTDYFLELQIHWGLLLQLEIKTLAPWRKSYDKHRQYI